MAYTDTDELDQDQLDQLPLRPASLAEATSLTGAAPISLAVPQGIAPAPSGGSITGEVTPLVPPPAPKSITDGLLGGANPLVAQPTMKENLAALEAEPSPLSQRHGFGGGVKNVLDVLGSTFAPNLTGNIPGTLANRQRQIAQAEQQANEEQKLNPAVEQDWKQVPDTNFEINSKTGETRPMGGVNIPPKEEKPGEYKEYSVPGNNAPVLATQVGDKLLGRDGKELPAGATLSQKPAAPSEEDKAVSDYMAANSMADTAANRNTARDAIKVGNRPIAGSVGNNPTWGLYVKDKGWVDPTTGKSLPGFQPPPTWSEVMPGTRTVALLDPDTQVPTTYQYNAKTGSYDKVAGLSASGTYAHQEAQAGASQRMIDAVTSTLTTAPVGTVQAWAKSYLLGTPIADPTLAGIDAQLMSVAALQPALHQFRSTTAMQAFEKIVGGLAKNPKATIESLKGLRMTAEAINPAIKKEGANEPPKAEPARPANVPAGFKWNANGPKGAGWYR